MSQVSASPPTSADPGPLVFGFGFNAGAPESIAPEHWEARAGAYEWCWLHFDAKHDETRRWLFERSGMPDAAARSLLAPETRPHLTRFAEGLAINLRGVNLNEGDAPEDMVSIRIWLDERRLISARLRRVKAAQDLRADMSAGVPITSPAALLARIAAKLSERMEPFVQEIEDRIDALEEAILEGGERDLRSRLAETRQVAVVVRRFIAPQREAVARLANDDIAFFSETDRIDFRETVDRITRLTEDIDAARERAMVLQDQLTDRRAEEMNRNMMVLSVAAAIFLPLGFLTGLFGVNVGGMPGVDNPIAFWVVTGVCIFIGVGLGFLFKYIKWL
ncbi:MAG: zinc transporter ZntB [Hyphococcus sp.]